MKKQIITTLAVVAMVGLAQAGIIPVANSSFEAQVLADGTNNSVSTDTDGGSAVSAGGTGTITDWTESNAADHLGYVINPGAGFTQPTDGNNAAFLQNVTITQTLTGLSIHRGDTITVTFDLWSQNAGTGSTFVTDFAGLGTQAASGVTVGDTQPAVSQSITFTATSDLTTADLSFRSTAGGHRYRLDNIAVTTTASEPGVYPTNYIHIVGQDMVTKGGYRSTDIDKIAMADGDAVYGTDGFIFFNVTPEGGTGASNQPALDNAEILLPSYVASIDPKSGTFSARDYGYVLIDDPTAAIGPSVANVESGLLVAGAGADIGTEHAFLSVTFNDAVPAGGIRMGVLVDNADTSVLVPSLVRLGAVAATATSTPIWSNSSGSWVFFDLDSVASNQTVTLYGIKRASNPTSIGGVVFDSLSNSVPVISKFSAAHTKVEGIGALGWSVTNGTALSILDPAGQSVPGVTGNSGKQEVSYSNSEPYTLVADHGGTRAIALASFITEMPSEVTFSFSSMTGVGQEPGVGRRDPSDIIKVGDTWHVWYSKMLATSVFPPGASYPSGYNASVWHATSTDEGHNWIEQGEAVPRGADGEWDKTSTFTPNILFHNETYYLYYTAVGPDFTNSGYTEEGKTALGVATSDSPYGPWVKSVNNPIMVPSTDHAKFDSYRIDDSCFAVRDGNVWLYYKGRGWGLSPLYTKMGLAVATNGEGPFVRQNGGEPVQMGGHEVQIWVDETGGVFSLIGSVGPANLKYTLQYAADGLNFSFRGKLIAPIPAASGMYRPELTNPANGGTPQWGIDMPVVSGDVYLGRHEMMITEPALPVRLILNPGTLQEGNRLGDFIGTVSVSNEVAGGNYAVEVLPIINQDLFSLVDSNLLASTVFDRSVTNKVGVFVRATSNEVAIADAFFDIEVLLASGIRKWRLEQFGAEVLAQTNLEAMVWGDSANPDEDEFNNFDEYQADTLPLDPASFLHILSMSANPSTIELTWSGGVWATQYVESCFALTSNTLWTAVATNLPPTAVTNIWSTSLLSTSDSQMYRIKTMR